MEVTRSKTMVLCKIMVLCIQAGSGNPTAKKTYIKHFTCWWKRLNELFSTRHPHFCQSIIYWMLTNKDLDVDIQLRLRYSQSLKPCELQKLIPNHQFSYCWIYLLLLTLFNYQILLTHPLITGHHRDSTSLIWILSQW